MPVPTNPRQNHLLNPTSTSYATSTPVRAKSVYPMSHSPSSTSYSQTVISGGLHPKLNVVTRVAIEGKTNQNKDGASVRLYLKISIPLDQVQPGTTIPLFPEENVRISTSQVHPLNNHSVPYNFSSTLSPLLHNAARALNLPARSTETFNSAFSISSPTSTPAMSSRALEPVDSTNGSENIATIDTKYTGHILVSGYHISYVLPNVFPTRHKNLSETESEGYARKHRRMSIGEKGSAQFMAAIDMLIPFVSCPPRYPYLLSIPIPRCLHNNIRLRIFPPNAPSTSFASLSSLEDDGNSWDLTSDPHVTRSASSRPGRSNSYTHFADDESSDSSTAGFSDGCGIQGTFPSAERIRIRWAKPMKNIDVPGGIVDDRRRVGVRDVKGEMTCAIRGKERARVQNGAEGLLIDVVYKGTCRGVWFPGVATLLGLDVGLETKGSDAYWVDGSARAWDVNGEAGFMGFDIGASPRQSGLQSRTASLDSNNSNTPQVHISPLPPDVLPAQVTRNSPSSSTSSLLRAPLPAQAVGDYSFEASAITSSSALTASSMTSLTPASSSSFAIPEAPPGLPITLHVNMNDIVAPAKNVFTFSIRGTILVVARPTLSRANSVSRPSSPTNSEDDNSSDPGAIVLPRFTVLAADHESTITTVSNDVIGTSASLEVYSSTGDMRRDAQAKTVLQKGSSTKCDHGGSRIALRSIGAPSRRSSTSANGLHTVATAKTSSLPPISDASLRRLGLSRRPERDSPLMIPSVKACVTPLLRENETLPGSYAVRLCMNAPSDLESEWLEFGLAQQDPDDLAPSLSAKNGKSPRVIIVSATLEGIPVKHETIAAAKPEASGLGLPFDQLSGKEWVSWVRIHVGVNGGGGAVVIDYVVGECAGPTANGKARVKDNTLFYVFLPSFSIPVGRLEVNVEASGIDIASMKSNFVHQQPTSTGSRLLNYSMEPFFYPNLHMTIHPKAQKYRSWIKTTLLTLLTWAVIIASFVLVYRLNKYQDKHHTTLEHHTPAITGDSTVSIATTTVTNVVTSTVYAATGAQWREEPTPTSPAPLTSQYQIYTVITPDPDPREDQTSQGKTTNEYVTESSHAPQPTTPLIPLMERYALGLPIQHLFNLTWPTHDFHATMERVMHTLDKVWYALRKAYHYPLDPP
ncbi:hypothetical protein DXG01_000371 [Tephrocybe rancida]|nr:hypothetical protein DXG01_000371 [Tephrocybe rancida]